ncbi:MAG: hypothetical protein JWN73_3548 [Betaproteobacteria bacterium]|nr:hypothetical protein [Betaproteobacteria bacterium]
MHSKYNPGGLALIQGLENVNSQVRVVQAAWAHFSQWQKMGVRCAMTARQFMIARSLLIEAIEEWALAQGQLLGLARGESGMEHLTESLEASLRRAAAYLGEVAATADPLAPLHVQFGRY